ncbi:MAG: type 4a pilus biogenesis protein PilO [candidate division Zixibacteria bacterium]|nr:type 4a pilus biogenesis protein PilO [candidate division Zixibacteria bacterium]
MDFKDPKSQKILLGALIVFLVIYFWYARIYSSNVAKINQKEAEYEMLLTDLRNVEMKSKSVHNLKAEYETLLDRYQQVELLLPEEKQIPLYLTQLQGASQISEARIVEIIPRGIRPISFYNGADFSMVFKGDYDDIGTFFANVANFPFLTNVTDVSFSGLSKADVEKEKKTILVNCKLSTYFIKESEKLQKVEF